jgi:hypothetical protein
MFALFVFARTTSPAPRLNPRENASASAAGTVPPRTKIMLYMHPLLHQETTAILYAAFAID